MTVKIGVSPLLWSNDDLPSLGGEHSLEKCLMEAKASGYTGVELGNKFPRDADSLARALDPLNLSLVSGWFSGGLLARSVADELALLKPHLDLLKAMGGEVLVYCDVSGSIQGDQFAPLSRRPTMSDSQWKTFSEKLEQVASFCLDHGVQLTYHHHMGTVIQTESEVCRLMESTGETVHLLLDTGHMEYAGGDSVRVLEQLGVRVAHVHLKDVRANVLKDALNRDLSFIDSILGGVFTVPGDGSIDFLKVCRVLAEIHYAGWLVIEAEQDPVVANPARYSRMGIQHLREMCSESELAIIE